VIENIQLDLKGIVPRVGGGANSPINRRRTYQAAGWK
jgi:hypothetical protein